MAQSRCSCEKNSPLAVPAKYSCLHRAVGQVLGHSSVKITEKHYSPWVRSRQAQLEADLIHAWDGDPVAQMETLRAGVAGARRHSGDTEAATALTN